MLWNVNSWTEKSDYNSNREIHNTEFMQHSELRHQPRHVNPRIQEKWEEESNDENISKRKKEWKKQKEEN